MQDLLRGYQPHQVGNFDFIELPMADFLNLNPIPINRDSLRRVSTMRSTFEDCYARNQVNTLTEVALGIVAEDFEDTDADTQYRQGDWFVLDGNTRLHYWQQYPDRAREIGRALTGKIHYLRSMEDVKFAYYPYNNKKSVERASQILQGLARRYNCAFTQTAFANGSYTTALDWASRTPGLDDPDIFEAFHICFDALRTLDNVGRSGKHTITKPNLPTLRSQAILAALLIALRFHPQNIRLHQLAQRLATIDEQQINMAIAVGELDPAEIIAVEYTNNSVRRFKNSMDADSWLKGLARDTKFAARVPQLDFLLYWIQKYIDSPQAKWNFKRGIKPELWRGAYVDFFPADPAAEF